MSPRAAWRLEQLGFTKVHDYAVGKVDWLAAGLPTEGTGPTAPRALSAMDAAVPVCQLDDDAAGAAKGARAAGWPLCVVTNQDGIVAGRLKVDKIADDDHRRAEEAMDPGPATIRAHEDLAATLTRMGEHHVDVLLVSTPEGRLLGAVRAPA